MRVTSLPSTKSLWLARARKVNPTNKVTVVGDALKSVTNRDRLLWSLARRLPNVNRSLVEIPEELIWSKTLLLRAKTKNLLRQARSPSGKLQKPLRRSLRSSPNPVKKLLRVYRLRRKPSSTDMESPRRLWSHLVSFKSVYYVMFQWRSTTLTRTEFLWNNLITNWSWALLSMDSQCFWSTISVWTRTMKIPRFCSREPGWILFLSSDSGDKRLVS